MKASPSFLNLGSGILAFTVWGSLVLYWKTLDNVAAFEILAHRMTWSLVTVFLIALVCGYMQDIRTVFQDKVLLCKAFIASCIIAGNWFLYIWCVTHDKVIDASLGYFINPLLSVLLGRIFLKEKLTRLQGLAIAIAAFGVLYSVVTYGQFPIIGLVLAASFATYGYIKKSIKAHVITGLFLETALLFPFSLSFLWWLGYTDQGHFLEYSLSTQLLLTGTGIITVIPLLLFAYASKRVQLATLGLMQYIAPTINLVVGVYIFHEPMSQATLITLICIWIALLLYTWCSIDQYRKLQKNVL